ncbi:MAG: M6 family metalloprotease domain-containing protein, partial [Planctomycetota bacterium]
MKTIKTFAEGVMKVNRKTLAVIIYLIIFVFSGSLSAAPIMGKVYKLRQPDGKKVEVKVWGDEFYQRVESLDGYTLVRDAQGWICYAELSNDQSEFVATDAVYGGEDFEKHSKAKKLKEKTGFKKNLKIKPTSRAKKSKKNREKLNYDRLIFPAVGQAEGAEMPSGPVSPAPLLGSVVGLTICIDFPDEAATISTGEVDNYCNQTGYSGFGNNGSIRDYFYDVSGGNLDYTNVVVGYYTAANNKSYYDDPAKPIPETTLELLDESLNWLEGQGFDFTQLSVDNSNSILALNVFYAGAVESGWSFGLWPHSSYYDGFTSSSGISSGRYQITDMATNLEIGTFCHENGHMICQWPDLYDYGFESQG